MRYLTEITDMIVSSDSPLPDALEILNKLVSKVVYVVDGERLVGTITDGDIRRGLLNNPSEMRTVGDVMFKTPATGHPDTPNTALREMMLTKAIPQLPIVDDNGRLLGLVELLDDLGEESRPNIAVVMCGGMGTRLGKLTAACPKPMLAVAGKPILEWIVIQLVATGFTRIFHQLFNFPAVFVHAVLHFALKRPCVAVIVTGQNVIFVFCQNIKGKVRAFVKIIG